MLLRRLPVDESSLDSMANGLLSRSLLGLPLDEPTRAATHYVALTAEQVRAAFQRWLCPDYWVQVSEGPVFQRRHYHLVRLVDTQAKALYLPNLRRIT
jgi:zinc protease